MLDGQQTMMRFMIHNIYFHESVIEFESELIDYLNYVFHNIEFDLPYTQQERKKLFSLDKEREKLFDKDKTGFATEIAAFGKEWGRQEKKKAKFP